MMAGLAILPRGGLAQESAREIVDRVDRMMRGRSSHGVLQMEVVTEHWTRTLEMEVWSFGTEHALIRVTSPRREAGTATLKVVNEVWNYLPRVDRTIKIPPSLMLSSWMGSHLTNDDLVKDSRIIDDYDIDIAYEGLRDGVEVWEFDLTPKPEVAVVWGRIVERVRKADLMPVWVHYYDDVGGLARTMAFEEYQMMGGRLVPALNIVRPADKPDESTTIRYTSLTFDLDIDEAFFSLRRLRQLGR
ncbi:MAG: outer membrane lipoprotein-sorting protein [Gemmatimonadetes bacterium]|nr:outer membrane lipoprotein-sorting protein [Gemmatimonadota bacterium]